MATALIAATAVILALAIGVLVLRAQRVRSDERIRLLLERVDRHLGAISEVLERVVSRAVETRAVQDLELTLDLDEVLRRLAAETATRTRAHAALVRVRGVGGERASASFGAEAAALPEAPLGPAGRQFRALTVNWAYRSPVEDPGSGFTSVLVVPIVEEVGETGSLAAYTRDPSGFDAEAVRALEVLAEEAAPAISTARRLSETERALRDAATGARNRAGYELELERAVAKARSSGSPLSVLVLSAGADAQPAAGDETAVEELAALLVEQTRADDVVCRTDARELGIVLPETTGEATHRFYLRLREEAGRAQVSSQTTFAVGLVEWRPNETSESLGARALASLGQCRIEDLTIGSAESASGRHDTFDAELVRAARRARRLRQPLSLLVLDLEVPEIEDRIRASLSNGALSRRVGNDALAVALPGASTVEAEELVASVVASLEHEPLENGAAPAAISAGITEVVPGDDVRAALARAEHALAQARHAGRGTLVVAHPNGDSAAE